jgi:transaldolase/glucose-6-phosphate isomerase
MNPLRQLSDAGQSIWLDYIRRGMTRGGELTALIERDGLKGMTSNPAIFEKAIAGSDDYADVLDDFIADRSLDPKAIYERLAIEDIQEAADAMRPVYDATKRHDGYVSLEVSPSLAHDTAGTIDEARRLWRAVARENLMIKVPGTPAGLPAIEQLLAEGINVNVTLIFSRKAYAEIAEVYVRGVEKLVERGGDPRKIASVASFFVSRIDSEVDRRLEVEAARHDDDAREARLALRGKIAVANAKVAYAAFEALVHSERWRALAAKGARPQRLLWASTGTKNPAYPDTLYVDELIGPDTVNTVPPATLDAFRDHGTVGPTLTLDLDDAEAQLAALAEVGVDLDDVTDVLLSDGVALFETAMDGLLGTIARLRRDKHGSRLSRMTASLPATLADDVGTELDAWDAREGTKRLWTHDASLWTGHGEDRWLGWLDVVDEQRQRPQIFVELADAVRRREFHHVLLLGMGGSSLFPDVLAKTFAGMAREGYPHLRIVDSTHPEQVRAAADSVNLERTLVVVSSKSGTTLEPHVLCSWFLHRMKEELGDDAGKNFLAITDPGSKLEQLAQEEGFFRVVHGVPEIGGRFSAFSAFGMVPAAIMGLHAPAFLDEAAPMVGACANTPARINPGVELGIILGVAARHGRDKLTIVASPGIAAVGAWLEQLVAESTGKNGQAIIPIDGEPLNTPDAYGDDRLFVHLRLQSAPHAAQDRKVAALEAAGHPVVRIDLDDTWALAQELFRWEVGTAVAGAVMGLHPFDQPDVEASKVETRAVTDLYERTGALPPETPLEVGDGLSLFTDPKNATALRDAAGGAADVTSLLAAHLRRIRPRDYFALLAYLPMTPAIEGVLQRVRARVNRVTRAATCLGFGPRFLHSTGQAYKGGPNRGVFLQITADTPEDLPIPDRRATFGVVLAAQARGDFQVLADRDRRALRVHLSATSTAGHAAALTAFEDAITRALAEVSA